MANVKLNTGTSIVDYMKSNGQDSSYTNRAKLAKQYGIANYTGTAEQNTALMNKMKSGMKTTSTVSSTTTKTNTNPNATVPTTTVTAPKTTVPTNVLAGIGEGVKAAVPASKVTPQVTTTEAPSYEQNAPAAYQSQYSAQIDSILNGILNQRSFSYNAASDPAYKAYSEQYTRQANQGMRDTMGNAAALTGGFGNSYAATAGQQTYDGYMSELNNMIPELYDAAYQRYQGELNNKYNYLSALQNLEDASYGQYRDTVGDYQTDRGYYYNKDYDAQQQLNYENEFDYNVSQDALAQKNYENEVAYQKYLDEQLQNNYITEFEYQKEMDKIEQGNYESEFAYQKFLDSQEQRNYENEFTYQKQQDDQERSDEMSRYLTEMEANQSAEVADASEKRITKYATTVDKMLATTTTDEFGNSTSKYTVEDIYDYLDNSGLSDEEIALIVNDNYELRKYIESQMASGSQVSSWTAKTNPVTK